MREPDERMTMQTTEQEPLLGLATTEHLLHELQVRFEVTTPAPILRALVAEVERTATPEQLAYRPIDADDG